ncbi:MAG: triose-phosphate isomerase [Verrucomicrobiales bacterium]
MAKLRKPIVAANWKMHKTPSETQDFIRSFLPVFGNLDGVDVVIAPAFPCLATASELLGKSRVRLAAQNMHPETSGAFTGEISAIMLRELYISYVIVGHSERRALFGETDAFINKKLVTAHASHLKPILCIGETLEQRDSGKIEEVLGAQLSVCTKGITADQMIETVVAYEPVWAIGTGRNATAKQAQEAHAFIRSRLKEMFDPTAAKRVRIQYGGSVKPSNAAELSAQPDVDGFLVGGASLESGSFYEIVRAAAETAHKGS